jgi:hypothetical protein
LPQSRRLTVDVLHYHRKVPTCAHDRRIDLSRVESLRQKGPQRISWAVLFIKAFSLMAARCPQMRQMWFNWPWAHLYQHPHSIAMVATHRDFRGEAWLFWSRLREPEKQSLVELQAEMNRYLTEPVEKIFKRYLQLSAMPTFARRLLWWWNLNVSGPKRAKRTGTFFLTTLAGRGAEIQHPPAFLTANLTYGPMDENGFSRVTIAYDHRIMDGRLVAQCLADLEATLNGAIAAELESVASSAGETSSLSAA